MRSHVCLVFLGVVACQSAPATRASSPGTSTSTSTAPAPVAPMGRGNPGSRGALKLEPPGLRLPDGVRPTGYQLELTVVPGEDRFSGVVTAELSLAAPAEVLWLHATNLEPRETTLTVGAEVVPARTEVVGGRFLAVVPVRPLPAGALTLRLAYTGALSRKDGGGLFQLQEQGTWYAYTHFEALDARRAFPCLDEPQFKVPWQLTLHVKQDQLAFSNTPVLAERDEPAGMKAVSFARTAPLPSYLVAFAVGPFEVADAGKWGQRHVPVRIITPRGQGPRAAYAVASTGPILETLERYFGTPYPFEKLDQLAVPISTGAMENPGLVTYGHQLILARPDDDTLGRQRAYASVCAHELAHMWFGDLVTLAWWDDLWLNEAFATWMSAKTLEAWRPAWDAPVGRALRRDSALTTDAWVSARQIRQPIRSEDDIANAFDNITYGKGSAVIDMFEHWVGPEVFRKGVQRYLREHAHGNATTRDFLGALSAEAGRDVGTPFSTFLDQPGAPRISATLECPLGAAPRLALSQRRHLPVGSSGDVDRRWQVPFCVRWSARGQEGKACTLLTEARGELELGGAKACPDWLFPDDGARGYYRASVNGAAGLVSSFKRAGARLTVAERVAALHDLAALAASGEVDLPEVLELLPLLATDESRHLVTAGLHLIEPLGDDFVPAVERAAYQGLVRQYFGPRARQLGFEVKPGEDDDRRLLRPALLYKVGKDGHDAGLLSETATRARAWLHDRKAVHPDLVETMLVLAAEGGDPAFHQELTEAARTEPERVTRVRMLQGLGAFRAPALVEANLKLVLGSELDIRESALLLWGAASDARSRDLAVRFVREHWDALLERMPKDSGAALVNVARGVCDAGRREEARAFFDGRSTRFLGGPRTFASAIEAMDLCIAYRARHQPSVAAWLERRRAPIK
jgi:cytosol alanyl aminopeptidase